MAKIGGGPSRRLPSRSRLCIYIVFKSACRLARVIGHNTIFVEDRDPLARGFQIV